MLASAANAPAASPASAEALDKQQLHGLQLVPAAPATAIVLLQKQCSGNADCAVISCFSIVAIAHAVTMRLGAIGNVRLPLQQWNGCGRHAATVRNVPDVSSSAAATNVAAVLSAAPSARPRADDAPTAAGAATTNAFAAAGLLVVH